MSLAARIAIVGLFGLAAGAGGGYWAGYRGAPVADLENGPRSERGELPPGTSIQPAAPSDAELRPNAGAPATRSDPAVDTRSVREAEDRAERARRRADAAEAQRQVLVEEVARLTLELDRARELDGALALDRAGAAPGSPPNATGAAPETEPRGAESVGTDPTDTAQPHSAAPVEAALVEARRVASEAAEARDALDAEVAALRAQAALDRERLIELNDSLSRRTSELEATASAFERATAEARAARETLAADRARAEQQLDDLLRLAAAERVAALRAEVDELWPAAPSMVDAQRAWIERAERELADLDGHRAALARAELETAAEPDRRWWSEALADLVADLEALGDSNLGALEGTAPAFGWGLRRRVAFASVLARTDDPATRRAWAEAARFAEQTEPYGELALEPQRALLPLGPDPSSGLLEFAWLASGAAPDRGPDGQLGLDVGSAAILVLVPATRDWIGAQSTTRGGPNYDGVAADSEGPPRQIELEPFLIGKHELTQGQWLRLTGANPSRYGPGTWAGKDVDLAHPVTDVSWVEADRQLTRHGLRLPTEAEWEIAARGGSSTPWFTGADARSLSGAVNLADRHAAANGGANWAGRLDWLDDGHTVMAPAASFRANGFGLHHVHGNVWEWCADGFADLGPARRKVQVNPIVDPSESTRRVVRGGAYNSNAVEARSAHRSSYRPETSGAALGLRVARTLDRP